VVTCYLILSNHPRRPAPQAASLRNLCVRRLPRLPRLCRGASRRPGRGVGTCPELLGALDSSSIGLTLNLQLSTFNRVSFLSSHLGLSQSSSKSFTIRTSMPPLPQPLYNPHLRAPLGSAGNTGLITPLESALTGNYPVTPVESALTKRWGVGSFPRVQHSDIPIWFPFIPFIFIPFQTLLHFFAPAKNSTLLFSSSSELFAKNTRGWGILAALTPCLLAPQRISHFTHSLIGRSLRTGLGVSSSASVSTFNCGSKIPTLSGLSTSSAPLFHGSRVTEHTSHCHPRGPPVLSSIRTRDIPL